MSPEIIFDPYKNLYSEATSLTRSSEVRDLMSVTGRSDIISFAGGLPYIEGLPHEDITAAMDTIIRESYAEAFQYGETEGKQALKDMLVDVMAQEGFFAEPEHILVTTGSQQALDLLARTLIDAGDPIVIEGPTYIGALTAFRPADPRFITIPLDDTGMQVELLAEFLGDYKGPRPKFIYVVPNFHNPGGVTMSPERRRGLLQLAEEHDILIIEDNPYGLLRFEGDPCEPLASFDRRRVVYVGTLSKIVSPGIRTGWVLAPAPIFDRLVNLKQSADLCSPSLSQLFAEQFLRQGLLKKNLENIRPVYRARRNAMLESLEEHFPEEAHWTQPQGGLFIWVTLPRYLDTTKMLPLSILQKVAYVPGAAFFPDGSGSNFMRLNFSFTGEERIAVGIKRLSKVVKKEMVLYRSLGLDST